MTESGRMRALNVEVSEHARALREAVEHHARPLLRELVADALHDTVRELRVNPGDLPPTFVAQVAGKVAQRFSLAGDEAARRAVLDGLWSAIRARQRHAPSSPAMPALARAPAH